jgi:uncharacterized protein YndB with AHSA1/START domain
MTVSHAPLARFVDRDTMTYERRYPHPIERVWDAVSTGEHLDVWLFPVTRVDQRVGGRATFTWGGPEEDGVEEYEVREFDPPRRITFAAQGMPAWMRFDLAPDGSDATVLSFTLHWPAPEGVESPWQPNSLARFHDMLDCLAGYLEGAWTSASMDALISRLTSGSPPPAEELELMAAYEAHVRDTRPAP